MPPGISNHFVPFAHNHRHNHPEQLDRLHGFVVDDNEPFLVNPVQVDRRKPLSKMIEPANALQPLDLVEARLEGLQGKRTKLIVVCFNRLAETGRGSLPAALHHPAIMGELEE